LGNYRSGDRQPARRWRLGAMAHGGVGSGDKYGGRRFAAHFP